MDGGTRIRAVASCVLAAEHSRCTGCMDGVFRGTGGAPCGARGQSEGADAVLAGIFAGAIAGSKYTGCVIAASVGLALVVETRSWKATARFMAGGLGGRVWPYL